MRKLPLLAVVILAIILATPSFADLPGSPLIAQSTTVDSCYGCLFAYIQFPAADFGHSIEQWGIYAQVAGNPITPLLLEKDGGTPTDPTFSILGIGTEETPSITGVSWFSFGLVTGSSTVKDANTYFGWRDGDAAGTDISKGGTIAIGFSGGPGVYYDGQKGGPYQLSGAISFGSSDYQFTDDSTTTRQYSVEAIVPEPESIVSLLACLAGVAGFVRLRRRR